MQELPEENLTGQSDLFELFPFMQSFPFGDYDMQLEKSTDYNMGLDPVIISAAGGFVKPEFVNFFYFGKYTKIALSFYTFDIQFIYESAVKIKRMDAVREALDNGLESDDIMVKIDTIKKGERFIRKLGSSLAAGNAFDKVLDEFLAADELDVDPKLLKKIKSRSKTLDVTELDEDLESIVRSFYNIHLHHMKILLGIVIAAKIH